MPEVVHADIVLALCDLYRARPARFDRFPGLEFTDREPEANEPWPPWLVVFRDDSGPRTGPLTAERAIGATVFGEDAHNPQPCGELARLVLAVAEDLPSTAPTNPISALLQAFGPVRVREESPRSRYYLTLTLAVVATVLSTQHEGDAP